jgi:mono/diheme cytochrome c family protein
MRKLSVFFIAMAFIASSCGGGKTESSSTKEKFKKKPAQSVAEMEKNFQKYNGVGPITALELPAEVDAAMSEEGRVIFEAKCTACHKLKKKFIGPSPEGILTRRTPAWIMNMILNPDEMVQKDALARQLLIENNGSPMANQNLKEEEARAVLEYFRTL